MNDERSRITFAKVLDAARAYDETGYNRAYMKVYDSDFREKLINGPDEESVKRLIDFVNLWRNRTRYSTLPDLLAVLRGNTARNASLRTEQLESAVLRDSSLETVQAIFEDLCNVKYFGPTGASKFLGIIHPQLCVMWDEPIRRALGYAKYGKVHNYSAFLQHMRRLSLEVLDDAVNRHGIVAPADYISQEHGFDPPFALATLVNHYVWVNITLPLQKKSK